jgi:ATP-dependent Clp protease ATP-binding subunit ClpA
MGKPQKGRRAADRKSGGRSGKKPQPTGKRRTTRKRAADGLSAGEKEVLLNLEEILRQRIVGKDEAVARVANIIRIRRTKLDFRPDRPDGAFLLVGPSGVGKTEFALAVAEVLLRADDQMILLDMADYTEETDLDDLLVTLFPGDTEALIEGSLTTPVRDNPRSVILLRGLEHAHPNVRRMLLHILDRGAITDAQGAVSFNQTIIFATTRLHPDETETVSQIGFNRTSLSRDERCRKMLEDQFTPELVSAFNEVLYFHKLSADEVRQIARYKVNKVLERLRSQKRGVIVSEKVYDAFITDDDIHKAGARYLNRALEEKLFTPLSKYLLTHGEARSISVDVRGNRVVIQHSSK